MVYQAYNWLPFESGGTPITPLRLNAIEQGLQAVSEAVERPDGSPYLWANILADWHGVADGLTDMALTLNQALAAGGVVYLPPGDYLVQDALQMTSVLPTVLTGPGRIISTFGGPTLTVDNARHAIEGITLVGGGATIAGQGGILIYSDGVTVRNTKISSMSQYGIYAQGNNVRIEDNDLDNCSLGNATDAASTTSIYVSGNYVKTINNTITNAQGGITYQGVDYTDPSLAGLVQGNRVAARTGIPAATRGIVSVYALHQRVVNNDVESYPGASIYQYGGQFTVISENNCYDGQGDGIYVGNQDTRHVDVESNNIVNCAIGIRVWDNAANVEVEGNSVADCKVGIMACGAINSGELPLKDIRIESNTLTSDGTLFGGLGIGVQNVDGFAVVENTVRNANHEGVWVGGTSTLGKVSDNTVRDASMDTTGTWAGIKIENPVTNTQVDDNILVGSMEIAVLIDTGVTGVRVRGNRWLDTLAGVTDNGTGTVLSDNASF